MLRAPEMCRQELEYTLFCCLVNTLTIAFTSRLPEGKFKHFLNKVFGTGSDIFGFPNQETDTERVKLLWLVKLRWMAVTLFFALSVPGLGFGYLDRITLPIYIGIVGTIFVFNLLTQLIWSERKKPTSPYTICFHLAFDLLALAGLLSVARGFSNPFIVLFLLNASLGGILLPGRLGWPFLILTHTFLGFLQFNFLFTHDLNGETLALVCISHVVVFSFWIVMHSLGGYLEKKHQQQAQARVLSEKQDRLRALGALAAGFSHEFSSPLNTAKIRLERALRNYSADENLIEAFAAIQACEQVIHQMNSSQIDTRDFQGKRISGSEFIHDVVDSWKESNPGAPIKMNLERAGEVVVPPITFAQVILNLLDNAAEAAPGSSINVSLESTEDSHIFTIEDRGPGVPDLVLARIGEPFVTTKAHGTGLGLYVSQLFAQSLGGDLSVQNINNSGCRISIRWPDSREEHE